VIANEKEIGKTTKSVLKKIQLKIDAERPSDSMEILCCTFKIFRKCATQLVALFYFFEKVQQNLNRSS
jgi:hypothetical protein